MKQGSVARRVTMNPVLFRYLGTSFLRNLLIVVATMLTIFFVFDMLELLRRASARPDVSIGVLATMALYKMPQALEVILPFVVLLAGMLTFFMAARRHELTVLRAAGLSVWQLVTPAALTACVVGIVFVMMLHPLGSLLTQKYNDMEVKHLGRIAQIVTVTEQGLWLREDTATGDNIVQAERINLSDWSVTNMMVLNFNKDGTFKSRLDAPFAILHAGNWELYDVTETDAVRITPKKFDQPMTVGTHITRNDIIKSFSDPDTISFWQLQKYINVLLNTGLDTSGIIMYFQGLLALPLFLLAMVVLSSTVSMRPPRFQSTVLLGVLGLCIGFAVFFLSNFFKALGTTYQLPPELAAWIPPMLVLLASATYLLNTEDG